MATKTEKYSTENITAKIAEYIADRETKNEIPILKECCFINEWDSCYIERLRHKDTEIDNAVRRLVDAKEIRLERKLYSGQPATGIIFALKQLGWKDNPQVVNNLTTETPEHKPVDFSHVDRNIIGQIADLYDKLDDLLQEAHRQQDEWEAENTAQTP